MFLWPLLAVSSPHMEKPEEVARKFLHAWQEGKADITYNLLIKPLRETIDLNLWRLFWSYPKPVPMEVRSRLPFCKLKFVGIGKATIHGDVAEVPFTMVEIVHPKIREKFRIPSTSKTLRVLEETLKVAKGKEREEVENLLKEAKKRGGIDAERGALLLVRGSEGWKVLPRLYMDYWIGLNCNLDTRKGSVAFTRGHECLPFLEVMRDVRWVVYLHIEINPPKCPKCGATVDSKWEYCPYCGTKLGPSPTTQTGTH